MSRTFLRILVLSPLVPVGGGEMLDIIVRIVATYLGVIRQNNVKHIPAGKDRD